ncbi:hypothetical protein [Devosia nitrariae]|uniref:DNA methyltransferase n=1 Tax=Devosia nitrariae TaxID=2071872 RepID=A0ABQ5VYT5_9HYPH|nr:hypothetical protein [Devosia nitrariae]GLQ52773.1 hypothetical protein GCM10010862_00310 [Devosia nitrariae]
MEVIVGLIVQLIAGGAGGNIIGQVAKQFSLGTTGNTIAGAVGGVAATWLAGYIPGLSGLVGGTAAAAAAGGLDIGALVGQGVTGLVGGGLLTVIAGLVKSMTAKA